jgi:dienelactone hydrolase
MAEVIARRLVSYATAWTKTADGICPSPGLPRIAFFLACLLAGCTTLSVEREAEVKRTWEAARVHLPGPATHRAHFLANLPRPPAPLPTVLYLHSCAGPFPYERWADVLAAAGYAVVMPDSFARQYRPSNCDPETHRIGFFPQAFEMRDEEIRYALQRLRELPWVDQRNLFLMGYSEGGLAVALWRGGGFNAQIITAWTCTHRFNSGLNGVRAPLATPLLAINHQQDPWYSGATAGSCSAKLAGYKNARELILPGAGHDTAYNAQAVEAVLHLLREQTKLEP